MQLRTFETKVSCMLRPLYESPQEICAKHLTGDVRLRSIVNVLWSLTVDGRMPVHAADFLVLSIFLVDKILINH